MIRRGHALGAALLVIAACGGGGNPRAEVLTDMADNMAVPGYTEFAESAETLLGSAGSLCLEPSDAALDDLRTALADTRARWLSIQPVRVGPVAARRSWVMIDNPVRENEIEALIRANRPSTITPNYLYTRVGSDQRGLRAMEYLFGEGLDALEDRRRCDYLVGVAAVIRDEAVAVRDSWTTAFEGGPPYRDRMAAAEGDEDLDKIVNDVLFQLKKTDFEIGRALGRMGRADPTSLVEGPAGLGVADLQSRFDGVRTSLLGDDRTTGLAPLLEEDVVERLNTQLDEVDARLAEVDGRLRDELRDHPDRLLQVLKANNRLRATVATEIVSALGVLVTFTDLDGDSG